MKIDQGNIIEYKDSDDVEINIKGKKMKKLSKEISLKSIYDLVVNIMNDVNIMKIDINQLKNDVKELKSLPTIKRELKQNNFL